MFELTHALVLELVAPGLVDALRVDHVDGLADPPRTSSGCASGAGRADLRREDPEPRASSCRTAGRSRARPGTRPERPAAAPRRRGRTPRDGSRVRALRRPAVRRPSSVDAKVDAADALPARAATDARPASAHALGDRRRTTASSALVARITRRSSTSTARTSRATDGECDRSSSASAARRRRRARPESERRGRSPSALARCSTDRGRAGRAESRAVAAAHGPGDGEGTRGHRALPRHPVARARTRSASTPDRRARRRRGRRFHEQRGRRRPGGPPRWSTTATHDTKRGEDTAPAHRAARRAPGRVAVERWSAALAPAAGGRPEAPSTRRRAAPHRADAPRHPGRSTAELVRPPRPRRRRTCAKAAREAKGTTSWLDARRRPRGRRCSRFARVAPTGAAFDRAFGDLLAASGPARSRRVYSVAVVLKVAGPGVPDLYQGGEGWDLSLVDPDNRRPVDFAARATGLDELDAAPARPAELLADWPDGAVKHWVTRRALAARAERPDAVPRRQTTSRWWCTARGATTSSPSPAGSRTGLRSPSRPAAASHST